MRTKSVNLFRDVAKEKERLKIFTSSVTFLSLAICVEKEKSTKAEKISQLLIKMSKELS